MKTNDELLNGIGVLTKALTEAGIAFQFSASINGKTIISWSGKEYEVIGLCEMIKSHHFYDTHMKKTECVTKEGTDHE